MENKPEATDQPAAPRLYEEVIAEPFMIKVDGRSRRYRVCMDCGSLARTDSKHGLIACTKRQQQIIKQEGSIAPCGHFCTNANVQAHLAKCSLYKTQINQI
jgi:hypothetical protein